MDASLGPRAIGTRMPIDDDDTDAPPINTSTFRGLFSPSASPSTEDKSRAPVREETAPSAPSEAKPKTADVIPLFAAITNKPPATEYVVDIMKDRRPVEWIVNGLIPRNSFMILAGEAKKARKTTLSTHLALCLINGSPFLGMTTQPCKVAMLNLEDGKDCVLDRFYYFGVRQGDTLENGEKLPLKIITDEDRYLDALNEAVEWGADVIIIDPLIEVELLAGVKNENDNIQLGQVLRGIRRIVRANNIVVLLLHHGGAKSDMRGATVLKGSTDGWLMIKLHKAKNRRLSWWIRRAAEGYVDVDIKYVAGSTADDLSINVDCASAPVFGTPDQDDEDEGANMSDDTLTRVGKLLQEAAVEGKPLSKKQIRLAIKVRNEAVTEALNVLQNDGLVTVNAKGKWSWKAADIPPDANES